MPTILDTIVENKRKEIERAEERVSESTLRQRLAQAPPVRDFLAAVARDGPVRLIAEVKKASPSRGVIRDEFDPVTIGRTYQQHGAACISVLTDPSYFQGSLADLEQVRRHVDLPVLRKDFVIAPYQLYEARVAGADAVLLIAECLDDRNLGDLHQLALRLGMTPLVELYRPENLPRVVEIGAKLIGINNRDLQTFQVDLTHTLRLLPQIPGDRLVVAESGIRTRQDVQRLERAGVQAVLVGEALMRRPDIGQAVDELLGRRPSGGQGHRRAPSG